MAAVASLPTFSGLKAQTVQKVSVSSTARPVARLAPVAALNAETLKNAGKALIAVGATLVLTGAANAASVKMGGDDGALAFVPKELKVASGEAITFKNNAGFPHNIVFDEDAVPAGVDADALSYSSLINAPGQEVTITLTVAGDYEYYCEPHQGAGMVGKITVS